MSDLELIAALAMMAMAVCVALYSIFRAFYPVQSNPIEWDDEINGDASLLGRENSNAR